MDSNKKEAINTLFMNLIGLTFSELIEHSHNANKYNLRYCHVVWAINDIKLVRPDFR